MQLSHFVIVLPVDSLLINKNMKKATLNSYEMTTNH